MNGWQVPSPRAPTKSGEELRIEREEKVQRLLTQGVTLGGDKSRDAETRTRGLSSIFVSRLRLLEVPLPLPGEMATMSCPHSYPLFYEPLGLAEGQSFLEVGLGSGYGAALAREIVGQTGLVVSMDIDPVTFAFARDNLERAGYGDIT